MNYKEQLLDPKWREKRLEIINRDGGMCFKCCSKFNLEVHHTRYIKNLMAWEYPEKLLVTLCNGCHGLEHDLLNGRPIPLIPCVGDIIKKIKYG